jgi:fructoselysine-6-P-deglycase FrlB-like protein
MSTREHTRSPYRIAYEGLLAVVAGRSGAASETVTLKVNARGDVQPEVVAVVREGESLMAAYARASEVLTEAQRAFGNGVESDTPFDV